MPGKSQLTTTLICLMRRAGAIKKKKPVPVAIEYIPRAGRIFKYRRPIPDGSGGMTLRWEELEIADVIVWGPTYILKTVDERKFVLRVLPVPEDKGIIYKDATL